MEIDIYTSCEATGLQAEYIRSGLEWDSWANNVERILDSGQVRCVHVMATINALCLSTLDQMLECIMMWRLEHGRDAVSFTLNILRFPSFQSPLVLPDHLRTQYGLQLADFLTRYRSTEWIHEHEINHLSRLIDYLDVVKTPHSEAFELPRLRADFRAFYTQYDARQNKDFVACFPDLVEWYHTL